MVHSQICDVTGAKFDCSSDDFTAQQEETNTHWMKLLQFISMFKSYIPEKERKEKKERKKNQTDLHCSFESRKKHRK